jgi:hypothetical protein
LSMPILPSTKSSKVYDSPRSNGFVGRPTYTKSFRKNEDRSISLISFRRKISPHKRSLMPWEVLCKVRFARWEVG